MRGGEVRCPGAAGKSLTVPLRMTTAVVQPGRVRRRLFTGGAVLATVIGWNTTAKPWRGTLSLLRLSPALGAPLRRRTQIIPAAGAQTDCFPTGSPARQYERSSS